MGIAWKGSGGTPGYSFGPRGVFKGLVKWERHGWRSRGKEIRHRDLWQEIWQLRQAAGSHMVVLWMPSHLNVKGNDEVDALAEAGCAQHPHNKRRRQEEPAWSALGLSPMRSEVSSSSVGESSELSDARNNVNNIASSEGGVHIVRYRVDIWVVPRGIRGV